MLSRPDAHTWSRRALSLCAGALLGSICAAQTHRDTRPDFSRVEALIEQRIASDHIPSVSVAVARNGNIVWEKAFGSANREQHLKATSDSLYALASVTKLMTATAIMMLRDRQQLELDRPANDYLGSAKLRSPTWDPSQATVRRVATHTAGLATYDNGYACRDTTVDCQDEMIRRFGVLIWRPGERFDYSNLGYGVLGDVVRHVSGMKYSNFLKTQVFAPLHMTHCSVGIPAGLEAYAAQRYSASDGSPADWSPNEPSSQQAAASVFCSAHDLVRFGMFHLKQLAVERSAVLSSRALNEMQRSSVAADNNLHYGFGWWHEERFGYRVMYVSGGYEYASALLFTVPSEKIVAVVLLNNGSGTAAQEVADEIVTCLVPQYRKNRTEAAAHDQRQSSRTSKTALVAIAGRWSGSIQTDVTSVPLMLEIGDSGGVHAVIASQPANVQPGAEFQDGQLRLRITGPAGLYQRDAKKVLDLDVLLIRRSAAVLNGGATTTPLSQPEWGTVTYFVDLHKQTGN